MPCGYHAVRIDGEEAATRLIVAPRRCYMPAGLTRALEFRRIPLGALPSGWVWHYLKLLA